MNIGDKVYRYSEWTSEVQTITGPNDHTNLSCEEYIVTKLTPKGFWIKGGPITYLHKPKFIRNVGRKKFAHTAKCMALDAYIIRKRIHIQYLERYLKQAKLGRKAAVKLANETNFRQAEEEVSGVSRTGSERFNASMLRYMRRQRDEAHTGATSSQATAQWQPA